MPINPHARWPEFYEDENHPDDSAVRCGPRSPVNARGSGWFSILKFICAAILLTILAVFIAVLALMVT